MKILAFETTCDETAAAVVEDGRNILSDVVFSQALLHAVYGGVVPEIASRSHVESISLLAERAVEQAGITRGEIDAVAVSYAPGLIGAVLVGVNFAKAAASMLEVPLIPVHHLRGHIAANYLAFPELESASTRRPECSACRIRAACRWTASRRAVTTPDTASRSHTWRGDPMT